MADLSKLMPFIQMSMQMGEADLRRMAQQAELQRQQQLLPGELESQRLQQEALQTEIDQGRLVMDQAQSPIGNMSRDLQLLQQLANSAGLPGFRDFLANNRESLGQTSLGESPLPMMDDEMFQAALLALHQKGRPELSPEMMQGLMTDQTLPAIALRGIARERGVKGFEQKGLGQ